MEIAKGIHRIQCNFNPNCMVYVYLLVGDYKVMLVDTGCAHNPEQDIIPYMQKIGVTLDQLDYILISHFDLDHQSGNRPMKEVAPQAIMMCHRLDKSWITGALTFPMMGNIDWLVHRGILVADRTDDTGLMCRSIAS